MTNKFKVTGSYIRERRLKKGIRLVDFAKKIGWTAQFANRIENGSALPPKGKIKKVFKTLDIEPYDFANTVNTDFDKMAWEKITSLTGMSHELD